MKSTEWLEENRITGRRILRHVIFWLLYWVVISLSIVAYAPDPVRPFMEELSALPVKILASLFLLYFLLPRFILPGRYFLLAAGLLFLVVFTAITQRIVFFATIKPVYYADKNFDFWYWNGMFKSVLNTFLAAGIALALKLVSGQYRSQRKIDEIIHRQRDTELKLLHSQINPHFLFNTLNNLYVLTGRKSEQAPEMVLQLSEMLSYTLYETDAADVALEKETGFLSNYIELEKIRYGSRLRLEYTTGMDEAGIRIAPLLFLPLAENCFKHGAADDAGSPEIFISVSVKNKQLKMMTENSVPAHSLRKQSESGIGLRNLSRRLELLYPGAHALNFGLRENRFFTEMIIETDKLQKK